MSIGKIIALLCGILAVALLIFLMNSNTPKSTNSSFEENLEVNDTNQANLILNEQSLKESNSSFDKDLKKIKELEKSLRKAPENLSKLYLVNCAPCHFKDGKGEIAPHIAGKSKEEILSKLRAYKENKIENTLMHGLLINLKENELESLASEISQFK